ncbi:MAG: OmpA family protein [Bacteroidetes bacterium]|nr:OmpA family protein [Bacteroidota bacterium]
MSSMGSDSPPRIVKKIKKHEGHHGGAWKVAYADFVTAMMALFIVLWVLSQSVKVQKLVANYFKDPIGFSNKGKDILAGNNQSVIDNTADNIQSTRAKEMEILKKMGDKILGDLTRDPEFSNLAGQIKIEFVKEGLKIEIVDSSKDLFFEIGTAKLTQKAFLLLQKMGDELSKLPNKLIIEGHTDSRPYSSGPNGYTNFELSADRANAARRALTSNKLLDRQIEQVRGYADRRLRDKLDPFNFVNRRISIIVKYLEESE